MQNAPGITNSLDHMIIFGKRTCAGSTHTGAPPSYINRILRPRMLGAYVFAASMVVFLANMIFAFVRKAPAGANPWGQGATTLLCRTIKDVRLRTATLRRASPPWLRSPRAGGGSDLGRALINAQIAGPLFPNCPYLTPVRQPS
jgi:hypothetical protein